MRISQGARAYTDGCARYSIDCSEWEGKTVQDPMGLCNINKIYMRTQLGELVLGSPNPPIYGDFDSLPEYDAALNFIEETNQAFLALPSHIRREYQNDPQAWYEDTIKKAGEARKAHETREAEIKAAKDKQDALDAAQALIASNT